MAAQCVDSIHHPLFEFRNVIILFGTLKVNPHFQKSLREHPKPGAPFYFLPRMAHKGPLPSAGNFHLVAAIQALQGLYRAAVGFLAHIRPKGGGTSTARANPRDRGPLPL